MDDERRSELEGAAPGILGPTPRALTGEGSQHGPSGEEESGDSAPETPGSRQAATTRPGDAPSSPEPFHIVRATTKWLVEPWRIAEDKEAHREGRCGGKEHCSACRVISCLALAQYEAARGANVVARALWQADGAALDQYQCEHGRLPTSKEWPKPTLSGYQLLNRATPMLPSGVRSLIARRVTMKWNKERWDALVRLNRAPAHYRRTAPLPLRASETIVTHGTGPGEFFLHVIVLTGEKFALPIRPRDSRQRREMTALAAGSARRREYLRLPKEQKARYGKIVDFFQAGEWKVGDCAIERDRRRPSRWYAKIAYTRRVDAAEAPGVVGINRGMRFFLAATTLDDDQWIAEGNDIAKTLASQQRERRERQRAIRTSSRGGRGRQRALDPIEVLRDKATDYRATKNQTIARNFARWCHKRGIGWVIVEDFEGIRDGLEESLGPGGEYIWQRIQEWPYYDLLRRVQSCLEEYGIVLVTVPPQYISQRCPRCGHEGEELRDLKEWRLRCDECGYNRHLDVAAASNVLQRGLVHAIEGGCRTLDGYDSKKKPKTRTSAEKKDRSRKAKEKREARAKKAGRKTPKERGPRRAKKKR